MTTEEMIRWIDNASYYDLLRRWRFAPSGDPFFCTDVVCDHYKNRMIELGKEIGHDEGVRISKLIGWGR